MNVVNRIELAIRRAASQMPKDTAKPFLLVADELASVTHDGNEFHEAMLMAYRTSDHPTV